MLLGKGVLKLCSKFKEEHPCRGVISIKFQSIQLYNINHHQKPKYFLTNFKFKFWLKVIFHLYLLKDISRRLLKGRDKMLVLIKEVLHKNPPCIN